MALPDENLKEQRLTSVSAALSILEHLGQARESGVNEIARALEMAPSRAHRLLKTLLGRGFVYQDESTKRYRLGIKLFELGSSVTGRLGVRDAAYPEMQSLHDTTGETVSLGILEEGDVLYLERIQTDDVLVLNLPPGRRVPAHSTALGKVLLAADDQERVDALLRSGGLARLTPNTITSKAKLRRELEQIRRGGYAEDHEEFVMGFTCVAAVIRGPRDEPVAALSVSAPSHRLDGQWVARTGHLVLETAERISARLGGPGREGAGASTPGAS